MWFKKSRASIARWFVKALQQVEEEKNARVEGSKYLDETKIAPPRNQSGSASSMLGNYGQANAINTAKSPTRAASDDMNARRMAMVIFHGRGGLAIEVAKYDEQHGNQTVLHVIPEGDDLAEALANIISLESLR